MDKVLNYLGLARRSRHLIAGTDSTLSALQNNKLYLIVLASDASFGTKDKVTKKAYFYNVPVLDIYDASTISKATGIKNPVVSGIDDAGLAKAILDVKQANN
jgi:ribosomal protein L7Ae-like RNA K-turn-binding protein